MNINFEDIDVSEKTGGKKQAVAWQEETNKKAGFGKNNCHNA